MSEKNEKETGAQVVAPDAGLAAGDVGRASQDMDDMTFEQAGRGEGQAPASAEGQKSASVAERSATGAEGTGADSASSANASTEDGAAANADDDSPEAQAARELAEHNALADVFDDVRRQSADSNLVTPERWEEGGFVPDHMTGEEFEMFVYEYLETYKKDHHDELEREKAQAKRRAHSVRSSKQHLVGVPPAIPHRRLKEIEADEKAAEAKKAAGEAPAASNLETASSQPEASAAKVASPAVSEPAAAPDSAAAPDAEPALEADAPAPVAPAPAPEAPAIQEANGDEDASPFAGLRIPAGYKLVQLEGEWVLVPDENAEPERREINCKHVEVLVGEHSYYLYDSDYMTDSYAHWAFLAAEDNPLITFVDCVREDGRIYPRPFSATDLRNPPFNMSDKKVEETWEQVRDSGKFPDIKRTEASNGDIYYYSTLYLSDTYAASLAEWISVERPYNV